MSFLYLVGARSNILDRALALTFSPTEDALFPKANLFSGNLYKTFRFSAADGTGSTAPFDLSFMDNGGLEDWTGGDPDDWTEVLTGTAAITEETTLVNGGSSAAKLTAGTGVAILRQTHELRAGDEYTIEHALRGDATNAIFLTIQNVVTGRWLQANGTWGASQANLDSRTAASYATVSRTFTLEGFSFTRKNLCDVRVEFHEEDGVGYVDDVALWPSWDFSSIHGWLGIPDVVDVKIQSDDNSSFSSPTDRITFAKNRPSTYGNLGALVSERYLRLNIDGETFEAPEVAEWVVGQKRTLARAQFVSYEIGQTMPQVTVSRASDMERVNQAEFESYSFGLSWALTTSQLDTFREEVWRRGGFGQDVAVIVPDSNLSAKEVYLGRFPAPPFTREFLGRWTFEAPFEEGQYAIRVS